MAEENCSNCPMRKKYDANPKSFAGRVWRWHINWCPGWKKYFSQLDEAEKVKVSAKYDIK